ncbi:MAG: dolichyl-phosphate-mannose--protein mannosyltransferase, partial [Nocardioides sp.]
MTTRAPDRPHAGPSGTTAGGGVPPARERALGRIRSENPLVGWAAAVGVALLAFGLRVWHLGTPRNFSFDETYYAKDAWSMLNH